MKILLEDFNGKVRRGDIFKLTTGNESLHEVSNDNGARVVNFTHIQKTQCQILFQYPTYSEASIIRIMKLRTMWAGHVVRMGEKMKVYRLLVG
jgi:hypothetical protein